MDGALCSVREEAPTIWSLTPPLTKGLDSSRTPIPWVDRTPDVPNTSKEIHFGILIVYRNPSKELVCS